MKAAIIGWLILALLLAAASYITRPYLGRLTDDDTAFAREYAGEMLANLEQITGEADRLAPPDAFGYYLGRADEFGSRKHAAVHLKSDLAYDFVYAFACAEEWCRLSARASRGGDAGAAEQARRALAASRREFRAIAGKDYTKPEQRSK